MGWKNPAEPVGDGGTGPQKSGKGGSGGGRGRLGPSRSQRSRYRHSEMPANLLKGKRPNFRDFSERPLINHANPSDFDSAIPRFESWRPSQ